MNRSISKYFQLLGLIIQHGKFRHSGENFNQARHEGLKELQEFIPLNRPTGLRNKNTHAFIAQAAFIKNAFRVKGGHLSAGLLSYIRIPKSASTSMSSAMLEKIYPALLFKELSETQINYLTDVNLRHVTRNELGHSYFSIVRNPFSRLVSVYRDFFEGKNSSFIYRDYLFGILPQQISFAEFINRISHIPDRLKDQHIKPQHTFLQYYERLSIPVKILKLEEPEKLNTFLSAYQLRLPHRNKSSDYDYRNYYSALLVEKVYTLYQADIKKFGYEMEYKNLSDYVKNNKGDSH